MQMRYVSAWCVMVAGTEMLKGIIPESEIAQLCSSALVHLTVLTVWTLFPD